MIIVRRITAALLALAFLVGCGSSAKTPPPTAAPPNAVQVQQTQTKVYDQIDSGLVK